MAALPSVVDRSLHHEASTVVSVERLGHLAIHGQRTPERLQRRHRHQSRATVTARATDTRLHSHHGRCLAYLAPGFYETLKKPEWLLSHPWWIAHYTTKHLPWCPWKDWDIWQYTGKGRLSGYNGDIDINRAQRLPLVQRTQDSTPTDDPIRDMAKFEAVDDALQVAVQETEEAIEAMQGALDRIKELKS